jgi:hypothetical protein
VGSRLCHRRPDLRSLVEWCGPVDQTRYHAVQYMYIE